MFLVSVLNILSLLDIIAKQLVIKQDFRDATIYLQILHVSFTIHIECNCLSKEM